jgi:AcrR family transcriptional regulator
VPRAAAADTRARILEVALDLFTAQGLQQTSLREIADRLGLTKPALYYHFASRDDLVRSLMQPLVDDGDALLDRAERDGAEARELLGEYFDLTYRHRGIAMVMLRDMSAPAFRGFPDRVLVWQRRLTALLTGPEPTLAMRARAVVAIGGLSDCTLQFDDEPADQVRVAAVDAACATLGLPA